MPAYDNTLSDGSTAIEPAAACTTRRKPKPRPPIAPASVYEPLGRRRYWWYAYRCQTCGAYQFGRAKTLDVVTGVRRAGCGHHVNVMAARIYSSIGTRAAA